MATVALVAGHHLGGNTATEVHLEPWQVINLIGAPLLAILFLRPVIDDFRAWFRARSTE